ncbi:MAG: hypothetical protein NWE89_04385 [Candidatus Bathyarchaeota archaeon]|nr:hypothetical protein [Candidatus Bathyarchaeota archaeon]
MTFRVGYLTPRETDIWALRRQRNSQSQISRMMGVSRQAIHKAYQIIDQKVEQAFLEAAEANNLDARTINLVEGVMEAYSPAHKLPVIVSFSKINGVKIWYLYEGRCGECHLESSCRKILENEADERGVRLTTADKLIPPTQLALKIFGLEGNN